MLAAKGFEYTSAEAASHSHRDCRCVVVPGDADGAIEGYDLVGIKARYGQIADLLGGHATSDLVVREIETRSPLWLFDGTVEEVSFETETLRASVLQKTPWEAETARRLAAQGFDPRMLIDYRVVRDADGVKHRIGLPDLPNGVEMKTPMESRNPYGCVKNYLENANGKEGLKKLVIDNTVSRFTDDDLARGIAGALAEIEFVLPEVTFLGKDGKLHCIWSERDQRPLV